MRQRGGKRLPKARSSDVFSGRLGQRSGTSLPGRHQEMQGVSPSAGTGVKLVWRVPEQFLDYSAVQLSLGGHCFRKVGDAFFFSRALRLLEHIFHFLWNQGPLCVCMCVSACGRVCMHMWMSEVNLRSHSSGAVSLFSPKTASHWNPKLTD